MSDDTLRRALARLAERSESTRHSDGRTSTRSDPRPRATEDSFRDVIEHAVAATDDLSAAARFAEETGLEELETAVERADRAVSGCADDGGRALASFRAFRAAAAGDQFRSGRGTSLGGGDVAPGE